MTVKESCPYCGKMTEMLKKEDVYISQKCEHCKKDLSKLGMPIQVPEEIDLKAPPEVELP